MYNHEGQKPSSLVASSPAEEKCMLTVTAVNMLVVKVCILFSPYFASLLKCGLYVLQGKGNIFKNIA